MKELARFIKPALFVSALCGTVVLSSLPTVLYYTALYTDFWNHFSTIKQQTSSTLSERNKTLSELVDNQTSCTGIPWGIISDANSYTDVVCELYSGDVCLQYLREWQECIPLPAGSLNIAIDSSTNMKSQEEREQDIVQFQDVLELYGFNDCRDVAIPMLCHYYFPLMASNDCISTGSQQASTIPVYTLTQEDCNNIDNTVCATPWLIANSIESVRNSLPDCSTLPSKDDNNNQAVNDSLNSLIDYNNTSSLNVTCRDDFILINEGCFPRCDRFEDHSHERTTARSTCQYIGAGISVLFSIIAFILSLINRKVMFRFPSFFLVLMVIDVFIIAMTTLIQAFDTEKHVLMCSSVNLLESLGNPTPYCLFYGAVIHYVFVNMLMWWFFHLCVLFYSVKFPFHAKQMKELKKTRKLAAVLVIIGFIVPIPGVIAAFSSEKRSGSYNLFSFPPEGCLPSANKTFFSKPFLFSVTVCIGVCLLISIFWIIHKNQQTSNNNKIKKLTTAEKKLIVALVCYTVFGTYSTILFAVTLGDADRARNGILEYFFCELRGHVPGKCDRSVFERHIYPEMLAIGYVFLGIVPTGVIVFIVSWHNLWKSIKDQFKSWLPTTKQCCYPIQDT